MASGDAQRVWFPEMLTELRRAWSPASTWDELGQLCARMTELRSEIRRDRNIQPPLMRCPNCGHLSRSDIRGVSIRSALFALELQGVITAVELKDLDRSWKKHRSKHELDAYGRTARAQVSRGPASCGDHDEPS